MLPRLYININIFMFALHCTYHFLCAWYVILKCHNIAGQMNIINNNDNICAYRTYISMYMYNGIIAMIPYKIHLFVYINISILLSLYIYICTFLIRHNISYNDELEDINARMAWMHFTTTFYYHYYSYINIEYLLSVS